MSLTRRSSSSAPFLTDSSESAASYRLNVSILQSTLIVDSHLAQSIKDLVEVDEYLAFCDLCNIVHALACIVPNASIRVGKTGEDGGNNLFEVSGYFLRWCEQSLALDAGLHEQVPMLSKLQPDQSGLHCGHEAGEQHTHNGGRAHAQS